MIKDNDFIHLPELYLTLETLKKHIKQHYNLNITNMANENKHSGYNDEQMAMTQLDIIHRYSVKLDTMITQEAYLEEWVKMKLSRVELMIASVKHALEGVEKFEDGGELARKQLLHISKYSAKLIVMLKEGSVLMSWMESNIAICADYMDGIYHHLDYTMGNRAKQMEYKDGGKVLGKIGNINFTRGRGRGIVKDVYFKNENMPYHYISYSDNIEEINEGLKSWSKIHKKNFNEIEKVHFADGGGVGLSRDIYSIGDEVVYGWNGKYYKRGKINSRIDEDTYSILENNGNKITLNRKDFDFAPTDIDTYIKGLMANGGGVEEYADGGRVTEKYFNRKVYKDYSEAKKELEAFLKMSEMKNEIFYDAIIKGVKGSNINQDITEYKVFLGNPYKRLWRVYFDTAITARNQTEAREKLIKDKKWHEHRLGRFDVKYIGEVTKFNDGGEVGDIPNMYSGKIAEQVWDSWTESQRKHFCYDHELMDNVSWKTLKMSSEQLKRDNWGKEFGGRTSWDWIKNVLQEHLEEGQYRNGGGVDSYGDMNPEQVWSNWSSAQRYHFIYDHMKQSTPRTQEDLSKKAYSFLPANVKQELHEHIHMGKYNAGGGVEEMREIEYADGGTIGTGKNAKALMKMDNDIWDKLNIDSGSQLYSDEKLQKKYAEELTKGLKNMGYETYTLKAADILTDWNYHALRSAMTFMGYFGEKEKNNQLEYKRETKKIGLSYYGLTPGIFTK